MSEARRLDDLGEDALIAAVVTRYRALPADVLVGPGDDAAVLDLRGPVVISTDTVVEGFDFRREWSSARDVGIKVAAQNLADVAAMGARPVALVVSLAAPPDTDAGWATGLADGLEEECGRAGAHVVGGDVSQSAEIVVTGTAVGVLEGPAVRRAGARPGDVVAVAGRLGASAAGLALLEAGHPAGAGLAALVAAHRAPRPPYAAGPMAAAAGATALIDTSDGLLRDAARLAVASGVRLDLDPVALAPDGELRRAAELLGAPDAAAGWVLTGGEDHAMLGCFPEQAMLPPDFRVIGRVGVAGTDGPAVTVGGLPWAGTPGWTHFRG